MTKIQPTWDASRMRQEFGAIIMEYKLGLWESLKDQPETLAKVHGTIVAKFVEMMHLKGLDTPLQLATYLGELTTNLVGGEVFVDGNDKHGTVVYESLPGWDAMKERLDLSERGRAQLMEYAQAAVNRFASEFGFDCQIDANWERPVMTMTFTQKK